MTRKFSLFAASFVVATGLFGAWTLTSSTVSEAAMKPGIDVSQIELNAPTSPFNATTSAVWACWTPSRARSCRGGA